MPYVIMCGLIATTYVAANINVEASESRIQSLLSQAGPKERNGWLMHARYWMQNSDTARAIEIRKQADELFPAYAQLDIARQSLSDGNLNLAISIADKLVRDNPYQVDFLGLQAEVYVAAGRFEEAISAITQAGHIKPSSPVLHYQLGEIYAQRGQHSLALQSYKKARVWGSTNSSILEAIGFTYSRMGLLDSAAAVADSLFREDPNAPGGHLLKLYLAVGSGNRAMARHHYQMYRNIGRERQEYQQVIEQYSFVEE